MTTTHDERLRDIKEGLDAIFGENTVDRETWLDATFEELGAQTPRNVLASTDGQGIIALQGLVRRVTG